MLRLQVAALLVRDDRVLLCLRSATRAYYPGVWDLPGGHIEPGESDDAALRRELREELGIVIDSAPEPPFARITDAALGFDLKLWVIRAWRGTPENLAPGEHERIDWFSPSEASALPLALPQYREFIERVTAGGQTR